MLNTKPIKKNINELSDNNILKKNNFTFTSDNSKIVILEKSKQDELANIVKNANSNIMEEINNKFNIGNTDNNSDNKIIREFKNEIHKDNNLNLTDYIESNKLLSKKSFEVININDDHNMNIVKNNLNSIKTNNIEWDDNDNCYIIYNQNKIEYKISNDNILKSILNQEHNHISIKKFIFITTWNSQVENYEFNFLDTIFTNNFDIMIKMQNFIYDTLINFDNLNISDTYNYKDIIIIFYYQLIIFLFNNYNKYLLINDINKLSRLYSSLTYRFSSIILKNILNIKNDIDENNNLLNKLLLTKSDILLKINNIKKNTNLKNNISNSNNKLKKNLESETASESASASASASASESESESKSKSESETESELKNNIYTVTNNSTLENMSINSNESRKKYKIINSRKLNKTSISEDEENKIEKLNIKNNGKLVKNIKDIFSEDIKINTDSTDNIDNDNENYNSNENGYIEINDDIIKYPKLSNNNDYKNLSPIENSFQNNIKSISTNNRDPSYNANSAIINGKIYKINI